MKASNDHNSYGWLSRSFHWTIAVLILAAMGYGIVSMNMPRATQDEVQEVVSVVSVHKTLGVIALLLVIGRVVWTLMQRKPHHLHPDRPLENWLAETVHWGLYIGMVIMPLSGWMLHSSTPGMFSRILWPLGQRLPGVPQDAALSETLAAFHMTGWIVLAGLIAFHILGVIKHAVIDRDATLARMTHGKNLPEPAPAHGSAWLPALAAVTAVLIWVATVIGSSFTIGIPEERVEVAGSQTTTSPTGTPTGTETPAAPASATGWQVQDGSLNIRVDQGGSPVEGQFASWNAAIEYAPETQTGTVEVVIQIASLTLGSVSDNAKGPEFLNASAFPEARFTAQIQPPASADAPHLAKGELTIAGKSVPAELHFTLTLEGNQAQANGQLVVDRRDFEVGAGYKDESTVGFNVDITFALTATR